MPRIEAANIEEHVRRQTGRIRSAATQLFRDLGYRGTDMEDIAQAVGLARNSLYRYYPNKDHILLACVLRDMVPFVEELKNPGPLSRSAAADCCLARHPDRDRHQSRPCHDGADGRNP